jgi:hypothetical protein
MKKFKKIMGMVLSVLMIAAMVIGCGGKPKIDPVKTVQSMMDAALKGEVTEYAKITGESEEDLKEDYEELLDMLSTQIDAELSVFGMTGLDTRALAEKMISSVKYDVKDATEDKDGNYTVNVLVYPSDFVELAIQETMKGAMATGSLDQLGEVVMKAYESALSNQTFGEPESFPVRIMYDEESKQYEVEEEDMTAIGARFFALPEELSIASGKDYGNQYLNWLKEDWTAADDAEKANCCMAIMQKVGGFSDEEMSWIDASDPSIQQSIGQMKDGINMIYDNGVNMSIGDFTEYMMSMGLM